MVAATSVTVAAIDDIPANDLQTVLGTIYGKAQYAADEVGAASYNANQANTRLDAFDTSVPAAAGQAAAADGKVDALTIRVDSMEGTVQWAADKTGFLDYHLRQIAALVGYPMPA
ncbi:hypothetical protein IOD40_04915 [Aquamicrobium sp. cd-1]|uniref:Uncharacterized protein n=2 Tax=Aquamicrobium zhengzhouense TaxID=2781738 RepID=A0ABS0SB40_9HYPH|nr:hypothetical protein [Aquamicrobium zhengzhouense]